MRFARHLCLLVIVVLSGLDQAVVQTYAWVTMIHDRAPVMGVSKAISNTFSGDHPCEICCALAEVTQEEKEDRPAEKASEKMPKLFAKFNSILLFPPALEAWPRSGKIVFPDSLHREIPTPPPELG